MADIQKEKKSSSVLGNRLRAMRDLADMSQSAVAKEIGLNTMSILNYETGKRVPDAEALRKFAQLYGCTADYLLGLADSANLEAERESEKISDEFYCEIENLPHNTKTFLMEDISRFVATTRAYAPDEDDHYELVRVFCLLMYKHGFLADLLRKMREAIETGTGDTETLNRLNVMELMKQTREANEEMATALLRLVGSEETS